MDPPYWTGGGRGVGLGTAMRPHCPLPGLHACYILLVGVHGSPVMCNLKVQRDPYQRVNRVDILIFFLLCVRIQLILV